MIFVFLIIALILPAVLWVMLEFGMNRDTVAVINGILYLTLIVLIIIYERKKTT